MAPQRIAKAKQNLSSSVPYDQRKRASQALQQVFAPAPVGLENKFCFIPSCRRQEVSKFVPQILLIEQCPIEDHAAAFLRRTQWRDNIYFGTLVEGLWAAPRPHPPAPGSKQSKRPV